jgi:hypothetical protein
MDMSDADDAYCLPSQLQNSVSVSFTNSRRYRLLTSLPGDAPLVDAPTAANFPRHSQCANLFSPDIDVDMLLSLAKCLKEEAHSRQLL